MEVIALALAGGLRERGHEVSFVVGGWNDGEFIRRLREANFDAQPVYLGKFSKSLKVQALKWTVGALARLPAARHDVRQYFASFRPDVVIINHRDWILMLRSLLAQQRSIFHVHELPESSAWANLSYRSIGNTVTALAAVSENIALRLNRLGVPSEKTHVIRNGISLNQTMSQENSAMERPLTIGIVGQIAEWKGHDDLFDALRILQNEGHRWHCAIFGRGDEDYVRALRARAEADDTGGSITWHGYQRDVNAIYKNIDICVAPSRFDDPFPTVALEAAIRAIPVLGTRRGGLPEIVIDGETGFLVESGDSEALATRLRELLSNGELRRRLGAAARARALEQFTVSAMVDRMEKLLMSVAKRGVQTAANVNHALSR